MGIAEFLQPAHWLNQSGGPRYTQLQRRLEAAIDEGVLATNGSLPPEREIAEITTLSRVTVRRAIQELAKSGVIVQRQGSGSFVREPLARMEQSLSRLTSFTEDMRHRGLETTSTWLERGVFLASEEEINGLGLDPGASVARIFRLREAGGRPIALERASLPLAVLPNPLMVTTSLYEVLEKSGVRPSYATQRIQAINLDADDAERLAVTQGAAGLKIERLSYLPSGEVVELTRSLYRGDAYDFVAELRF